MEYKKALLKKILTPLLEHKILHRGAGDAHPVCVSTRNEHFSSLDTSRAFSCGSFGPIPRRLHWQQRLKNPLGVGMT